MMMMMIIILDTWKLPFMALCKLDFVMGQYGRISEFPEQLLWKSPLSNFNKVCGMVYGRHGGIHL
jgi:hypothetical protein